MRSNAKFFLIAYLWDWRILRAFDWKVIQASAQVKLFFVPLASRCMVVRTSDANRLRRFAMKSLGVAIRAGRSATDDSTQDFQILSSSKPLTL